MTGDAIVLGGRSIAWASVGVKYKGSYISTFSFGGNTTKVDEKPGTDIAESALIGAINEAVNYMDVDKALGVLSREKSAATSNAAKGGT